MEDDLKFFDKMANYLNKRKMTSKQNNLVGVVLLLVIKPAHHTGCDYILATSRQPRKLIFGIQP
jgi:hypothetical protein